MPKQIRRRQVSLQQARAYLGKAEQYVEAASAELEAGRSIAAASLAVHAGINAADAVTGMRLGQRAAARTMTKFSRSSDERAPTERPSSEISFGCFPSRQRQSTTRTTCRRRLPEGPSNGPNAAWPWPGGSPLDKTRLEPGEQWTQCSVP
jgi:hypothetical protein